MTCRHVILGAGISGLCLAWLLKNKFPADDIVIVEQSNRAGGWIESRQKQGFLLEMGPRSLRSSGKGLYTLQLIEQLGLEKSVIKADPAAHIRYVYENGRLRALPCSIATLLFSSYLPLLLKAVWRDLRSPAGQKKDESVYSFACRHFGIEVAERFIDPLTLGIFAADCRHLSIGACFPLWADWDQSHGSLIKAALKKEKKVPPASPWIADMQKAPLFSFSEGLETLVLALAQKLPACIHLQSEVQRLHALPDGMEVELANCARLKASHVYSTLPALSIAKLIEAPALQLSASSVAVVGLGFNQLVLKKRGFGYLIPTKEKEAVLGVVWDSCAFPQQNRHFNQTRLTVMIDAKDAKDFKKVALDALRKHLNIEATPDLIEEKVVQKAIPRYPIGYPSTAASFLQEAKKRYPHLTLMGTAFHGVAVNDCIAHAFSVVESKS